MSEIKNTKETKSTKRNSKNPNHSDGVQPVVRCQDGQHTWQVYSTVIEGHAILVKCTKCPIRGSIDDPTKEEWSEAFYAPSNPYLWNDPERVCCQ